MITNKVENGTMPIQPSLSTSFTTIKALLSSSHDNTTFPRLVLLLLPSSPSISFGLISLPVVRCSDSSVSLISNENS